MIDLRQLSEKFTEIVALRLDLWEQRNDGVWPPYTDLNRYKARYIGTPKNQLPPYTVEINLFKTEVDQFVSMLMAEIINLSEKPKDFPQGIPSEGSE